MNPEHHFIHHVRTLKDQLWKIKLAIIVLIKIISRFSHTEAKHFYFYLRGQKERGIAPKWQAPSSSI